MRGTSLANRAKRRRSSGEAPAPRHPRWPARERFRGRPGSGRRCRIHSMCPMTPSSTRPAPRLSPNRRQGSMTEPKVEDRSTDFFVSLPDGSSRDVYANPWNADVLCDLNPDTALSGIADRLLPLREGPSRQASAQSLWRGRRRFAQPARCRRSRPWGIVGCTPATFSAAESPRGRRR